MNKTVKAFAHKHNHLSLGNPHVLHELLTNLCTYIGYDTFVIGNIEVISSERICGLKYLAQFLFRFSAICNAQEP